jgi:hypothetical protein
LETVAKKRTAAADIVKNHNQKIEWNKSFVDCSNLQYETYHST